MEPRWLGAEVGSDGGRHYCQVGLVVIQVEARLYIIVSTPDPRGRCSLLVAVAEAKEGSWAQNFEGDKVKREDKWYNTRFTPLLLMHV